MKTPWAILLTHFSDDTIEPFPRSRYEEIFTTSGVGKWNMVDFFQDMSQGTLDLSGSKVFGWFRLTQKQSDYTGSGLNPAGRQALIAWARQKATEAGVALDDFFNVVVVLNTGRDLFGGISGVVCGDDGANKGASGLAPSLLGQEMAHGYGLQHSRLDGSTTDYTDPYDIMSTQNYHMAPHPDYPARDPQGNAVYPIGPGMNAANMSALGWLDESRTWEASPGASIVATVALRPLHRPDLPGFLALRLGSYLVEFRVKERWDAGFDKAGVLVHYFEDGHSYLVTTDAGDQIFTAGSVKSTPSYMSVLGSSQSIRVVSIDTANLMATVQVQMSPAAYPNSFPPQGPFDTPWVKWREALMGQQALVVLNGQAATIRRGTVGHDLLEKILLQQSTAVLGSLRLQQSVKREAFNGVAAIAQRWLDKHQFAEPAAPASIRPDRPDHL